MQIFSVVGLSVLLSFLCTSCSRGDSGNNRNIMSEIDKEMREKYSAVFVEETVLGGSGDRYRYYVPISGEKGYYEVPVSRFGKKSMISTNDGYVERLPAYYPDRFPGSSAVGEWQGHSAPPRSERK